MSETRTMPSDPQFPKARSLIDFWETEPCDLPFQQLHAAAALLHEAEFIADKDADFRHLPEKAACSICGSKKLWGLELYDFDTGGYPQHPWRLAVRWHCPADDEDHGTPGYCIELGQTLGDRKFDAQVWHDHLSEKVWYHHSFLADLLIAEGIWRARHPKAEPPPVALGKPAFASIPRRPPRAPSNPRDIRPSMRTYVMERDNFVCRRCGHGLTDGVKLVIDHIVPVARGGTGDASNLQTLCNVCNAGKSDGNPHPHDHRGR